MRQLFAIILFLLATVTSWSQSPQMRVKLKNGQTATFPLEEVRKITFGTITSFDDSKHIQNIVKTFTLFQNYPNPFNPSTTITFEIPQPGNVELNIFNTLGQLVKHDIGGHKEAGVQQLHWDGKNDNGNIVSSGLYLYQVRFNNSTIVRKMVFMK